jgi:hypothetical protein
MTTSLSSLAQMALDVLGEPAGGAIIQNRNTPQSLSTSISRATALNNLLGSALVAAVSDTKGMTTSATASAAATAATTAASSAMENNNWEPVQHLISPILMAEGPLGSYLPRKPKKFNFRTEYVVAAILVVLA